MKNTKRKDDLLKLALKKQGNGGRIYQLISSGKIDKIIEQITDDKTEAVKSSLIKKGYLTGNEQFIDMLSNFMYYFDMKFPTVDHKDMMIQLILESQVPEFLLCKKYWGDNNNIPYFTYNIDRTIANNFFHNISFVYEPKVFDKYGINPRKMKLDHKEDLEVIIKFLKELLWTNINEYSIVYLFDEFSVREKVVKKGCKNKTQLEILQLLMDDYKMHFEFLLKDYEEKKDLLKFIK